MWLELLDHVCKTLILIEHKIYKILQNAIQNPQQLLRDLLQTVKWKTGGVGSQRSRFIFQVKSTDHIFVILYYNYLSNFKPLPFTSCYREWIGYLNIFIPWVLNTPCVESLYHEWYVCLSNILWGRVANIFSAVFLLFNLQYLTTHDWFTDSTGVG